MLLKVVAPAIVFAAPVSDTRYAAVPAATVMPVVALVLPWKATVCPSAVFRIAIVPALTALANVAPPLFITVSVPMSVPTTPATFTAPVVLMVRFDAKPPAVPDTAARLIGVATPVPTVSVTPSASSAFPIVISPVEVPPTSELPSTETPVSASPSLITPTPAALTVPFKRMPAVAPVCAVATTPPVKAIVSPPSPSVSVPVFKNVAALSTTFVVPVNATLYGLLAVVSVVMCVLP